MENNLRTDILDERRNSIFCNSGAGGKLKCESDSVAGSVSQRACVYCGARVVLNPITDAFHIVHGPIGCASYTWDIRGSLTSGPDIFRNSFSTDLREQDVVFGGEKKLLGAIDEIVAHHSPKLIFVYATCIVGVIGDDLEAICKQAAEKHGITVIPVQSSGFAGNKSMGYKAAGKALMRLMMMGKEKDDAAKQSETKQSCNPSKCSSEQISKCGCQSTNNVETTKENSTQNNVSTNEEAFNESLSSSSTQTHDVNFLGDFNLAGETWITTDYLKQLGINVIAKITGDSRVDEIKQAHKAKLNIVQCAGSMTSLAKEMEEKFGIPYVKISFFGIEDTKLSLMMIAEALNDKEVMKKAKQFVFIEELKVKAALEAYKDNLVGKRAAIYVGGGFKAISLIKQFNDLGIKTVMVGTQTGRKDEYEVIRAIADEGTVILDDTNPAELEKFIKEKGADILVGGVKERPLAYKLGIAFCDHNHERKHPLCGFEGSINFAKEIDSSINSPVWKYV